MLRKLLILPPIALGVAVLAFLISQKEPPERTPVAERAQRVRTIDAAETTLVPRVLGYGTVRPAKVWNAVAQVAGEVVSVHPDLKKGAILKAGTEIISISPLDYELAIAQAEANIRATEARLKELAVDQTNTRQSLEIEARALKIRETELARKEQLLTRGTVSQSAVDQETRDTLAQTMRVQDLRNSLRLIPTQQEVQREQKAIYEAQLEAAKLDLARTRIALPFTARIAETNVEAGQFVQVGETLGVADDIATAEIEAQIPTDRFRDLARAAAPGAAKTGVNSLAMEFMGRVCDFTYRDNVRPSLWAAMVSTEAVVVTKVMAPPPPSCMSGTTTSQPRTVERTSTSKFFHQFFSLSMPPPALTFGMKMSTPSIVSTIFSIHASYSSLSRISQTSP